MDAGTITAYKIGSSLGVMFSGLSGSYSPTVSMYNGSISFNFGQRPFAYTPPTGFLPLNTYNLPDSTIEDGSQHFNTVLYTGNGSTQSITGVGFQPDFLWLKRRDSAENHGLHDAVRGSTIFSVSNQTTSEYTRTNSVTSFDSDGFSLGDYSNTNTSGSSMAAWNWKANGSGTTNSAGTNGASIATTYSTNTDAGISIVSYTGTGSNGTIYHGLGKAPDMMIFAGRNNANNWFVYHSAAGIGSNPAAYRLLLNLTNNRAANGTFLNNTQPTASVATIGTDSGTNQSGVPFISYHFASIEGFSDFGSYLGNGSTDGPFVYTGFRPAFIILKAINRTGHWTMFDSARDPYNLVDHQFEPNYSSAEYTPSVKGGDFLSNGWKCRSSETEVNQSGYLYLYMAFAENPFKYALAR
jgi:hypothetical protein